ncbi:hypothetical protein [Leifsonia shinshuensis]|uniref:hypothetical protein n=1 Tax=Leifsonia shinshuensis TaxID=150026 RepID=UPI00215662C3|nr:hypothetical protein [Leifsonia shinshuensis]
MTSAEPPRMRGRRSAGRRAAVPAARRSSAAEPPRTASAPRRRRRPLQLPLHHRLGVSLAVIALVCGFSIVPTDAALAATVIGPDATTLAPGAPASEAVQHLLVDATIGAPVVDRDTLGATDSIESLARIGTNESWAELVLMFGGWPTTKANVDFMLRWMRQENGPPDWWNRNNPLNNGYGSGGGAGLGSYPDLVTAAKYCAENLQRGYPAVVAGLTAGTSADVTAAAIWASPWAGSHYGYGSHWSTSPVQIVTAPASAWGN